MKTWFLVHKWTSLVSTVFLLMLCVTGLPLIFHHEIDHALGYSVDPPPMAAVAGPASLDAIVADARRRRPGDAVQFLVRDPDEPDVWFVRTAETLEDAGLTAFFTYDARSGAFLHAYPVNQGIMNVLLRLHVDMFAGLPGTLFLGGMGLLLAASLVSGTVLYGPFMRRLDFGAVRRDRSARLKWLDLHNLLGIVTLVWVMVVGVTGVINTLSIPIFGQWRATQLAEMTAPFRDAAPLEGPVSVDKAVRAARAAEPEMDLSFMAFPGTRFASPNHFIAFMQGTTPWTSKLLKPVMIDAQSGTVVARRDLPLYVQVLLVSQPLHFGDYGGMPLKIIWAILTVVAIVVLGSGLYLWLARRKIPVEARLKALKRGRRAGAPARSRPA
ncbi:MAG: PepSY domain-containing protein [Hyphomicrobiales bacterium]|nr:PepSY domain-containing protein [Hyphomicrobiales bacterium]